MSRVAKMPIKIPQGVTVTLKEKDVQIKGPKGLLIYKMHPLMGVEQKENTLVVMIADDNQKDIQGKKDPQFIEALSGTVRANLNNMVTGVIQGYERKLLLVGVGYRAQLQGKQLNLSLGFSHPVRFAIPEGITIELPSPTEIIVKGIDKRLVGQVAANIRMIRPIEPYKGKGVRYSDERVVLKETKKK